MVAGALYLQQVQDFESRKRWCEEWAFEDRLLAVDCWGITGGHRKHRRSSRRLAVFDLAHIGFQISEIHCRLSHHQCEETCSSPRDGLRMRMPVVPKGLSPLSMASCQSVAVVCFQGYFRALAHSHLASVRTELKESACIRVV